MVTAPLAQWTANQVNERLTAGSPATVGTQWDDLAPLGAKRAGLFHARPAGLFFAVNETRTLCYRICYPTR